MIHTQIHMYVYDTNKQTSWEKFTLTTVNLPSDVSCHMLTVNFLSLFNEKIKINWYWQRYKKSERERKRKRWKERNAVAVSESSLAYELFIWACEKIKHAYRRQTVESA